MHSIDRKQYGQEFLIYTPEPASLLLALGLGSLLLLKRRQQLQN